jgi:hypothetical protein
MVSVFIVFLNFRHSRESGNLDPTKNWIPAFAGMTLNRVGPCRWSDVGHYNRGVGGLIGA